MAATHLQLRCLRQAGECGSLEEEGVLVRILNGEEDTETLDQLVQGRGQTGLGAGGHKLSMH